MKKREELYLNGRKVIPTDKPVSKTHPNGLAPDIVAAIVSVRKEHNRCAYIVWQQLQREGITVSLSSVERTINEPGLREESVKGRDYTLALSGHQLQFPVT